MERDARLNLRVPTAVKEKLEAIAAKEDMTATALVDRYLAIIMEVPQATVTSLIASYKEAAASALYMRKERDKLIAETAKVSADMDEMSRKLVGGKAAVTEAKRQYQLMKDNYIDIQASMSTATAAMAAKAFRQTVQT